VTRSGRTQGPGASWEAGEDTEKVRITVRNVKDPDEGEDEVRNLLTWVWTTKDHLRKKTQRKGVVLDEHGTKIGDALAARATSPSSRTATTCTG
jgi:hypothetical protein